MSDVVRIAAVQPRVAQPWRWRIGDFELHDGRVFLRQTGNSAKLDRHLLAEVGGWLVFQAVMRVRALAAPRRAAIWFSPEVPHDRYIVRGAMRLAGLRVAKTRDEATAAFYFEDATTATPPVRTHARAINFGCGDISKGHVAKVFEQVFGYPLAVDPTVVTGDVVEKSELNGAHDGRVVDCPRAIEPGKVYQRLIDNVEADGLATDLRTHIVGGVPILVWVKRRAVAARFAAPNISATLHEPDAVFSTLELGLLAQFARAMGADWCALDVLRDRDGRIYVVDVNKTDAGPIVALSLGDKLRSTAQLAKALLPLVV